MSETHVKNVIEAALLAAGRPLPLADLIQLFEEHARPTNAEARAALDALAADYEGRGIEIKETASGFRIQVRKELASEVSRLWPERPARYSRALLETLALIAYRQPITRAEIEQVRGVAVNPNIIKTLLERNWVRVVGHRDVPGRPELLGTTREFLDYFGLKSLDELPPLAELKAMGDINLQLELANNGAAGAPATPPTEAEQTETAQTETAQTEATQSEAAQTEATQTETAQTETAQTEAAQTEVVQTEATQIEAFQSETVQTETVQSDGVQSEAVQADAVQADAVQSEAVQAEAVQAEAVQAEAVQAETVQAETVQGEATQTETDPTETAEADTGQLEAAQAVADGADAVQAEATATSGIEGQDAAADYAELGADASAGVDASAGTEVAADAETVASHTEADALLAESAESGHEPVDGTAEDVEAFEARTALAVLSTETAEETGESLDELPEELSDDLADELIDELADEDDDEESEDPEGSSELVAARRDVDD